MKDVDRLKIKLDYDKESGLSLRELNNYLQGLNKSYSDFTSQKSELLIKEVSKGSICFDFTQYVIIPVLTNVISNGVYDFGKSLIESVKYIKSNKNIISLLAGKDKIAQEHVKNALVISGKTGDGATTINQINIKSLSINGNLNLSLYKEDIDTIRNLNLSLDKEDIDTIKQDVYESVKLEFKTVTCPNEKGSYSGFIKEISKDAKKISFKDSSIKNSFSFSKEPFEKTYLVSVIVYYNASVSVRRYEVTENLGIENRLL